MSLKRFGVSLEGDLLEALDRYVNENGFANRSQAIRFLVEKNLAERKWLCNHIVAGTVIILYERKRKDIRAQINDIESEHSYLILSGNQYFINNTFCLYVVTAMGMAHQLTELSDRLTTIKGIKHGKLTMSRAD